MSTPINSPAAPLVTLGGRVQCRRCQARSKRTKQQCKAPALKGKTKCRFHGGASTGPKTEEGRKRCAEAKTVHGNETRALRNERRLAASRLLELETLARKIGMISGPRTAGRKPKLSN
jgi:hypothetical protein